MVEIILLFSRTLQGSSLYLEAQIPKHSIQDLLKPELILQINTHYNLAHRLF